MPVFKLVSTGADKVGVEFRGENLHYAMEVLASTRMEEADLWQDEEHICTISRSGRTQGFWVITSAPRTRG